MYTIRSISKRIIAMLKEAKIPNPILDAEVLLMHFLGLDRLRLMMNANDEIEEDVACRILVAVEQRRQNKPIQYITNRQEFMGLDFFVEEGVLIPRADTEISVEMALDLLKKVENPVVIDMCTGSGAIAISLAYYRKDAQIIACDISQDAINCCKINIERHHLEERVKLIETDLFARIQDSMKVDMILSNPPYIETKTMKTLMPSVKDYEPHLALDGGTDGLDFYRVITKEANRYLKAQGILLYEIGYNQAEALKNIMQENQYEEIQVQRDLAGLDRCIYGKARNE